MADEKFSVTNVRNKMAKIENYFCDFSDTLSEINAFVQGNVNASIASSAFGDLGGKLLSIWDHNASTFNDFHENFDNWAQVVAIIGANNNQFAVDALATYRDTAGTLDGVQAAREFVSTNNGIHNMSSASNYGSLSNDAKRVLDGATKMATFVAAGASIYGGHIYQYEDSAGNKIEEYYDKDGRLVGKKVVDSDGKEKYYDKDGKEVNKLPSAAEWEEAKKAEAEERKKAAEEEQKKQEEIEEKKKDLTREEFVDGLFEAGRKQFEMPYNSMNYGPKGSAEEGFGCAMFVSYCYNETLFGGVSGQDDTTTGFYGSCMNYWGNVTKDNFDAHNKGFVLVSADEAQEGDVVCFVEKGKSGDYFGEASNCFHVGLYEGDGKMMHSSRHVTDGVGECSISDYVDDKKATSEKKEFEVFYLHYTGPGVEGNESSN